MVGVARFKKYKKNFFLCNQFQHSKLNFSSNQLCKVVCQVVLEYERAVIFRLGQLLPGGAKGPGKAVAV